MLEARGLTKRYGAFLALDRVDFQVRRGEILGYLGPNGSRKSTTVNAVVRPDRAKRGFTVARRSAYVRRPGRVQAPHRVRTRGTAPLHSPDGDRIPDAGGAKAVVFGAKLAALLLFTSLFIATAHVSLLPLMLLTSMNPWAEHAVLSRLTMLAIASVGASASTVLAVTAIVGVLVLVPHAPLCRDGPDEPLQLRL